MTRENIQQRISIDPAVCFGRPVVRGTRIWVSLIVNYLAAGESIESIRAEYPQLTEDDIRACLAFAADRERKLVSAPPE